MTKELLEQLVGLYDSGKSTDRRLKTLADSDSNPEERHLARSGLLNAIKGYNGVTMPLSTPDTEFFGPGLEAVAFYKDHAVHEFKENKPEELIETALSEKSKEASAGLHLFKPYKLNEEDKVYNLHKAAYDLRQELDNKPKTNNVDQTLRHISKTLKKAGEAFKERLLAQGISEHRTKKAVASQISVLSRMSPNEVYLTLEETYALAASQVDAMVPEDARAERVKGYLTSALKEEKYSDVLDNIHTLYTIQLEDKKKK